MPPARLLLFLKPFKQKLVVDRRQHGIIFCLGAALLHLTTRAASEESVKDFLGLDEVLLVHHGDDFTLKCSLGRPLARRERLRLTRLPPDSVPHDLEENSHALCAATRDRWVTPSSVFTDPDFATYCTPSNSSAELRLDAKNAAPKFDGTYVCLTDTPEDWELVQNARATVIKVQRRPIIEINVTDGGTFTLECQGGGAFKLLRMECSSSPNCHVVCNTEKNDEIERAGLFAESDVPITCNRTTLGVTFSPAKERHAGEYLCFDYGRLEKKTIADPYEVTVSSPVWSTPLATTSLYGDSATTVSVPDSTDNKSIAIMAGAILLLLIGVAVCIIVCRLAIGKPRHKVRKRGTRALSIGGRDSRSSMGSRI